MRINQVSTNHIEVFADDKIVFFSYDKPVAAYINGVYYRSEIRWSNTTSKHVNQWLKGHTCVMKPQSFFDNLI